MRLKIVSALMDAVQATVKDGREPIPEGRIGFYAQIHGTSRGISPSRQYVQEAIAEKIQRETGLEPEIIIVEMKGEKT